jgi:hypothetical protein
MAEKTKSLIFLELFTTSLVISGAFCRALKKSIDRDCWQLVRFSPFWFGSIISENFSALRVRTNLQ